VAPRERRPDLRRHCIGGRLHDALLAELDALTAVLSTEQDNEPALALYRGRGWQVVVPNIDFGPGSPPFVVLGKRLAA
jgi:ribosomal protein S18 acetylase RimI-like enzyme